MSWDVPNPKGRIGSAIALALFGLFIAMTVIWGPLYLLLLFVALEAFSGYRFFQEWVQDGAWAK